MPEFTFKAKNFSGQSWNGTMEADSAEALEYTLNDNGYFPLEIKEKRKEINFSSMFDRVSKRDLSIFCRQLSVILNSGVTIIEAISILAAQTGKRSFRDVLEIVGDDVQKGKLLSQSMAAFPHVFPEFLQNMIRVGEASGTLENVMEQMADYYEQETKLQRKVKSSMTYPIILGVMTIGVIVLLMVMVLPMFSTLLTDMGGQMPAITKVLMGMSHFMVSHFFLIFVIFVGIIAALVGYGKTPEGRLRWDSFLIRFPITRSITIKMITARFARSMGILLRSGINVIQAMTIMKNLIGNRVVERKFETSTEEVQEGRGIADSLNRIGIFPPLLIQMVKVGERTGELDQMLLRTSGFFDEEVEGSIAKMTSLIEPVMLIIMGLVVGTILLSIFLPMLSIINAVS